MATGDFIDQVRPVDLIKDSGYPIDLPLIPASANGFAGAPFRKGVDEGYVFFVRVPLNGTPVSTGLTFQVALVDDPINPSASGVVRIGITAKLLASSTDVLDWTVAATEQVASHTLPATTGQVLLTARAIAVANLDSAVAGSLLAIRVRRLASSDTADTHKGRVLLLGIVVSDT